jgi:hypothetical protein
MARDGRRRRVLNEEVRSASSLTVSSYIHTTEPDAPRYGEQASIENHPQITDFVPRRKRALIVTLLLGIAVAGGAQATIQFSEPMAASLPGSPSPQVLSRIAAGSTAWTSAIALLLCAMLAKLIHSLRRHRVDDYAGRYRVWRWVIWGALAASANATVGFGQAISALCIAATGKSLSATGAEWWLVPLVMTTAWIGVRLMMEISESRSSLVFTLGAAICYAVAGASALGWSPVNVWAALIVSGLPLVGHTLALAGMMVFGRYVVLDVQGLIEHKRKTASENKPKETVAPATVKLPTPTQAAPAKFAVQPAAQAVADEESWEDEEEDHEGAGRKLSKAERKALRRQRRAA